MVRDGDFRKVANQLKTFELLNKEILILGFGRIGKNLIKRCNGFEMNVNVYDPFVDESVIKKFGGNKVENLKKAFIVVEQNISLISQLNSDCLLVEKGKLSKKIKSSDKSFFLYSKFISFTGIVNTFPFLSIACIDNKISLNSFPKQPAFILIPPPIVPGIQDKNSKPLKLFFIAKSDKVLSKTPLPAIIMSSLSKETLLKKRLLLRSATFSPTTEYFIDKVQHNE